MFGAYSYLQSQSPKGSKIAMRTYLGRKIRNQTLINRAWLYQTNPEIARVMEEGPLGTLPHPILLIFYDLPIVTGNDME